MTTGWQGVGGLGDTTKGSKPSEPVPGIAAVSQPLLLRIDEWVCGECHAPIVTDENGANARIEHTTGCKAIADIVRVAKT